MRTPSTWYPPASTARFAWRNIRKVSWICSRNPARSNFRNAVMARTFGFAGSSAGHASAAPESKAPPTNCRRFMYPSQVRLSPRASACGAASSQWNSGKQMQYLRTFAFSIGKRYQELVPLADLISPNKTHDIRSYEGWAYCARTPDKNVFLAYFEKGCPRSQVRGARLNSVYRAEWFDPRKGAWQDVGSAGTL